MSAANRWFIAEAVVGKSRLVDAVRQLHGEHGLGGWLKARGRANGEQHFSRRHALDAYQSMLETLRRP